MGILKAFDPVEDLYEIVYDDYAAEELTWSDLQKLMRASGDTVTAPAATEPRISEDADPRSIPEAIQSQKDLMSKNASHPETRPLKVKTPVRHVREHPAPRNQDAVGPTSLVGSHESVGTNGKGVKSGYSSEASSDAQSISVDGERIVATKTRDGQALIRPKPSPGKPRDIRQSPRLKSPNKDVGMENYVPSSNSESSDSDDDFLAELRGPKKRKRKVPDKKAVPVKRLNVVRSSSLQSYFTRDKVATATAVKERDPTRPLCDGRLDECDRETAEDITWSTPVSPTHGVQKKRKSPAGKGGMDVWVHVGRIREGLHTKYARRNANLLPYTHACYHCGATLALGWSKKNGDGDRLPEGCWQTTIVHRHLRVCGMLPREVYDQLTQQTDDLKKVKLEKGVLRNTQVAMPIKLTGGEVVFSRTMDADIRQAAKVAIARTIMYSQTKLPDHYLDCPFEKDKQRLLYKAGFDDATMGKTDSSDYPTLGSRAVADYVESEDALQRAYGRVWAKELDEASSGNPHSQVQSDLVTLSDRGKWQSIGHTDVCPIAGIPFTVATGFRHVDDKKNDTCAVDMEQQSQRFFGRKQLAVAHSIVTDVGAFGVGAEVVREYPFGTQLHRDKCMMHQMSKVIGFGALSYGYKDGKGGELHHCPQIAAFNADFRSLEICFRRQDNAEILSLAARELGMADLRCDIAFRPLLCCCLVLF